LLVAGLIFLIVGLVFFAAAPIFLVTVKPTEVWETKSSDLYKELVYRMAGSWNDSWIMPYVGPLAPEDAKDFVVNGTIEEVRGHVFNLYVFNPSNYEYWKAGMPYKVYIEMKGATQYSFEFRPSNDDRYTLRFVVENPNPAPIFSETPDLVFKLSATMQWQEKSLKEKLVPLAGAVVLSMLGVLLALIGIALAAVGGIVHLVRRARPEPEAPTVTPAPPFKVTAPAPAEMERCPHCGEPLTGKEGQFCHKCWRRIR